MSAPSLELKGIRKSFPTSGEPHLVLDGIDFTLMRGERIGICGLNGAGKTTLINIIAGALGPDRGEVVRHSRMSWPLGYSGGFHAAMTGLENVRFIARIYGRDVEQAAEFAQDFAELGKFFEMPMRTYSSGMRSRLAFAVSMAVDFELYLIDEVMSAGDLRFHEKCRQAIQDRRGRADFVIVSHSLGSIEENCNRFALLHKGKLTTYDDFKTAQEAYAEVFSVGQKDKRVVWKPSTSGPVEARILAEGTDSVDIELRAMGAGNLIAYWGNTTEMVANQGDAIAVECPVQLMSGSTAQIGPQWTGLQFVERDRAGSATASNVEPRDFLNGLPQVITGGTVIRESATRYFQMGVRVEMAGPGDMVIRLGRPFLNREAAPERMN
ncbi:MAG TPA: ABC transporter ATP-binding protein [Rhizomicrobium sp.]|nr:ABC transporter ATP-binding protein [Rhizomicrobium sp.]